MADWDNSRFTYARVLQGGTGVYYKKDDLLRYAAGVKTMQGKLNQAGYNCGTADGEFGTNTDTQVRNFQRAQALTVDGCAGKNTLIKLDAITSGTTSPPPSSSMNATKVNNLIDYCNKAATDKWGYVWGASGEKYTDDVALELFERHGGTGDYNKTYYTETQIGRWKDHRVADCSGLLRAYLKEKNISLDQPVGNYNANAFYVNECSTKKKITSADFPTLLKGSLLFDDDNGTKVHVGVCIGGGEVIHSSASEIGVIKQKIPSRFNYYGIPKFLC